MNVPESQIVLKKKVGKSSGKDVTYIKTSGGLHLVVNHKGIVLGSGPHRGVARHLAQKFDKDLNWTELSKSDHIDSAYFEHLLPEYEQLTRDLRSAQGITD
jgi:hypothetical protein